jgi:uncharacterized protein
VSASPSWLARTVRTLAGAAAIYALICVGLYLMQDRLVFPAPGIAPEPPRRAANIEPIELAVAPDVTLRGLLRRAPRPSTSGASPLVVYLGGNAEEVTWWGTYPGWPSDWAVALVNYRGYGKSGGEPSEAALYADSLRLYDTLAARADIDARRIVLFGRSLGSGVATYLATMRPTAGVILVSPYDSVEAIARELYPWLPVGWLLRHRFDSLARATRIDRPLLMLVTPADRIVPLANSERLYAAWAGPKALVRVADTDHTDIASAPAYWSAVGAFLRDK